jgi:hypothetical protein
MLRERTRGNCKHCGKPFETWQDNRLYCNESCRRNFRREAKGEKPLEPLACNQKGECKECGREFQLTRNRYLFCSKKCRSDNSRNLNKTRNESGLSTGSVGALREFITCVDLMKRGYEVFRALSPNSSCDLIAMKEGKIWRVEVTTGYIRKDGSMSWVKHDESKYDVLAAVMPDSTVIYVSESF